MARSLSLIVPAFNAKTIDSDLKKIDHFLNTLGIKYEIICVVDGLKSSRDQTLNKANKLKLKNLKVISYPQNRGKGFAVRFGFSQATAEIIGFFDAGNDIKVENLKTALDIFEQNDADAVIGSKIHNQSRVTNYPKGRKLLSLFTQTTPKLLLGLNVSDTQVGLKLFSQRLIKKALPKLTINGFAFDLEILLFAKKMGYKKIFETPVDVTYNSQSTIKLRSLLDFLVDYLRILLK